MNRRKLVFIAVAVLAFVAGWIARGFEPQFSCRAGGGYYNKPFPRTCVYVEPSDDALNEAYRNAAGH